MRLTNSRYTSRWTAGVEITILSEITYDEFSRTTVKYADSAGEVKTMTVESLGMNYVPVDNADIDYLENVPPQELTFRLSHLYQNARREILRRIAETAYSFTHDNFQSHNHCKGQKVSGPGEWTCHSCMVVGIY